jgi:dTDP-4-amino-4,6-dideoxygalactose transaminase
MTEIRGGDRSRGGENVIPFPRRPGERSDGFDDTTSEALKSGWLTQGREAQELARRGAALLQREVVPVAGGVAAAHLALLALDLARGDEVVLPALVPLPLANLVLFAGGIPVFADITAPETPVLDPDDVVRRLSSATRAIVVYHPAGYPAPAEILAGLAAQRGLALIEVCWDALGARLGGRAVGSFGTTGAFALQRTPDGGGLVACADDETRGRIEGLRSTVATPGDEVFEHDVETILGNGYRINEAAAAAGVRSLETLRQRIAERRAIVESMHERSLRDTRLGFAPGYLPSVEPSYDLLPVVTPSPGAAAELVRRARLRGLEVTVPQGVHRLAPHNARLPRVSLMKTEDYCARSVELRVVEQLLDFVLD